MSEIGSLSYFGNIYSKITKKCMKMRKVKVILDIYKCPFLKSVLRLLEILILAA